MTVKQEDKVKGLKLLIEVNNNNERRLNLSWASHFLAGHLNTEGS